VMGCKGMGTIIHPYARKAGALGSRWYGEPVVWEAGGTGSWCIGEPGNHDGKRGWVQEEAMCCDQVESGWLGRSQATLGASYHCTRGGVPAQARWLLASAVQRRRVAGREAALRALVW